MASDWLDVAGADGTFRGYLSLPKSGQGPGLVLLQEIFGINAYMRQMADLFAAEGYVTVVPDLFWRIEPGIDLEYGERDKAVAYMGRFDFGKAPGDITATVQALRAHPAVSGPVGALGYCLGGKLVVLAASRSGIACAVSYYGVGIHEILDEASAAPCPMQFHFAALDHYNPPERVQQIRDAFAHRADVSTFVYEGADHGFNSRARAVFDHSASLQAHGRAIAFLHAHLGQPGAA